MPRPQKCRRVCAIPRCPGFAPVGGEPGTDGGAGVLGVDEYEALRLVDLEGLTQEACAARMDIARTTVTGICASARRKVAGALVYGRPLVIEGGHFRLCEGGADCRRGGCPCRSNRKNGGKTAMKLAVTYENGMIYQHFGHTRQFKVYEVEEGQVKAASILESGEAGHGALATLLKSGGVDALICGGIGGGAQNALAQAGITLYAGVQGEADAAVQALLAGTLAYSTSANCDHHGHEEGGCHSHGGSCGHTCG